MGEKHTTVVPNMPDKAVSCVLLVNLADKDPEARPSKNKKKLVGANGRQIYLDRI